MKLARNKAKGKPLKSTSRLTGPDNEGNYTVSIHNYPICMITPEDVVVFHDPDIQEVAISMSHNLVQAIGMEFQRVGTGRYRVASVFSKPVEDMRKNYKDAGSAHNRSKSWGQYWDYMRKLAPEYFPGIAFNLKTGECLNRRVDALKNVNGDKRKEWLRQVKSFKRLLRVQTKLGVWKALIEKGVIAEEGPDIADVMDCMAHGRITESVLHAFGYEITRANRWNGGRPKWEFPDLAINNWFDRNSITMRRAFGVFAGEGE